MESRNNHEPLILTKREFLQGFASVSGISAVMAALDAWDIGIASAATAPPALSGRADGTRVLILGAGIAGLATAYEERVGHLITYHAEVQELRQDEQEVQVRYRDALTGDMATATGDYCVTTIPLAVMSNIPNDLSDRCKAAVGAAAPSQVGKLALQMNRRFWEEDDAIFGGSSQTDTPGGSVIYPSHGFLGPKGVVQGYYVFGDTADSVGAMGHGQRTERGLANGEQLHPGQFRRHYDGKALSVDWKRVPYSLGGWESWSDEARREHFPVLLEPQGRVYFAGAYLSYLTGWQAGAVESAWYQVERLHANAVTV